MKTLELDSNAIEYILFQRTELLPQRNNSILTRIFRKLGLGQSYEDFVRSYAAENVERVSKAYTELMKNEADRIAQFIPTNAHSILDIGCGLAALDFFLHQKLSTNPDIYLLDKTQVAHKIHYMFEQNGAFYNSLEIAQQTLIRNGIAKERIKLIEAPDDGVIDLPKNSIDVVISTISWGFHYPISIYIDSVFDVLSEVGVLLVDVRHETGGDEELRGRFREVDKVGTTQKFTTLRCAK